MPSHYIGLANHEDFHVRDFSHNEYFPDSPKAVLVLGAVTGTQGHYTHLDMSIDKLREINAKITDYLNRKDMEAYDEQSALALQEVQRREVSPGEPDGLPELPR